MQLVLSIPDLTVYRPQYLSFPHVIPETQLLIYTIDWRTGPAFRSYYYPGSLGTFLSFLSACMLAIFSYMGVEIIGIVAEETEHQRRTLPHAVRRVAFRALVYHVGAIFVLGLNVSANDPILKEMATLNYESPFALMCLRAGIPALGHVVNAVTVVALLGVANTRLYVSVRTPAFDLDLCCAPLLSDG